MKRKGQKKYEFYVSDELNEKFLKNIEKLNMSKSAYFRMMMEQTVPIESPSKSYYQVLKELHGACNNINQLVMKANRLDWVDKNMYKKDYDYLCELLLRIIEDNTKPQKVVIKRNRRIEK